MMASPLHAGLAETRTTSFCSDEHEHIILPFLFFGHGLWPDPCLGPTMPPAQETVNVTQR